METYHDKDYCKIERDTGPTAADSFSRRGHPKYFGMNLLIDRHDDVIDAFPKEFTDDQIWHALDFANSFYRKGLTQGSWNAQHKIKQALGVK